MSDNHDPHDCNDPDCPRFPCRMFQAGVRRGYEIGYAAGYDQGFPDGIAACPLPHGGR